jgi:serine/threonine protein phosphatase PrpC
MTMTPIHRIPVDGNSVAALVSAEIHDNVIADFATQMRDTLTHNDSNDANTVMMDWAMQIRSELGIDWATCIYVASVLYYG